MERVLTVETIKKIGERIRVAGWVSVRRDHGRLIFIDLRDETGILQLVFRPDDAELYQMAEKLRPEWVIAAEGTLHARPKGMENPDIPTGTVELPVEKLEILAEAKTPPFPIDGDGLDIDEELRLKYRYLDLRRSRLQRNLRLRDRVTELVRAYLHAHGFVEIETPLLTKTSPEGARDFLVPSRLHPGKFYALPQAPQQYKQLLMIAGFERYFQIARAIRDEDLRADRGFEHTQIDLEMSFAGQEEVFAVIEGLMVSVAEQCGKRIFQKPFPRFTHEEAMAKFGADKFDLRGKANDSGTTLAFAWVTDFPLFERDEKTKRFTFAHNPFSAPKSEHVPKLLRGEDLGSLHAQQYDLVCNGYELASGGVRISNPEVQRKIFEVIGLTPAETADRFGHLLEAYEYGAPPHAGIAPGLDRLIMILAGEEYLREVQAFPMTSGGKTAVMDAPSDVDSKQLDELNLAIKRPRQG
ncbi:MAG: aspartate--tRNA ligase [Candidatus Sungbacteria bacterium]|uniref:Aspartate--tRNA(Asp/Asn) ligase n=1 Tax=Candidatus Sungiibacteriota bacterium TaxID=2750080 RepID=A0A932YXB4_9BACT|nr:aspartate--tRNA ligase [Candidatus Sungbacteria bacterium]